MTKRIIFLLLGLLLAANASAQVMPRSGTHFTFGIPEGSDALTDPTVGGGSSLLIVNILSHYEGRGIVTSPNGYCQEFTFLADSVTTINLPYSFMHLKDIGKTSKGVLVKTSQPSTVVFHDFLAEAGEATQIYPDEALDTSYRVTSWGLYNDLGEDNHSQFIITAPQDSTDVTIIPSVNVLGNHPAGVPIITRLNRGECYIVKADITASPTDASLSNSMVHSTKPVSIIAGVSCGYNPLGRESCDEIIDQVLPRKYVDTIFYVAPLRDTLVTCTVLFTSEVKDYFVIPTIGPVTASVNGRAQVNITGPTGFVLTTGGNAPPWAQCFVLSEGSDMQVTGDPSIVTVLPRDQYSDTLLWYTPAFTGPVQFNPAPFLDYVSVVYPKAFEGQVLLDGSPIASRSTPQPIGTSPMNGTVAVITPGAHILTSPVPIFATVSGFTEADGYSFLPGTIAPKLKEDTLQGFLGISTTDAKICRTFDATITAKFKATENITSAVLNLTYDANLLTLLSVNLGSAAQGGSWITDTRIPGTIKITATCLRPFTDSGALITLTFSTGPKVTSTTMTASFQERGGELVYNAFSVVTNKTIDIQEIRDTLKASFSINAGTTHLTGVDTATVNLLTIPTEPVNEIDLFVNYNHDLFSLLFADVTNTLISGTAQFTPTLIDPATDQIRIVLTTPQVFSSPGIIARLMFNTFVSDSLSGKISLRTVIGNTRPCPLDILADQVSSEFTGTDICGTASLRALMKHEPFVLNSIVPNPSNGSFTIDLDRHLFGEPLHVSLVDMLGNEVWSTDHSSPDIHEIIPCAVERVIPNGSYFVRISGSGKTLTEKIVIRN